MHRKNLHFVMIKYSLDDDSKVEKEGKISGEIIKALLLRHQIVVIYIFAAAK